MGTLSERNKFCLLFVSFVLLIFIQMVLFNWMTLHSIIVSSILTHPFDALAFYLPKLAISIAIASLMFFTKRKYWTIYLSVVINIWMLSNLIYYRSYASFLDVFALGMAGNMKGFWGSVFFYIRPIDSLYFILTALYGVLFVWIDNRHVMRMCGVVVLMLSYLLNLVGVEALRVCFKRDYYATDNLKHYLDPFSRNMRGRMLTNHPIAVVRQFSILHQVGFILEDYCHMQNATYCCSEEDLIAISEFDNQLDIAACNHILPPPTIVLVVFESLEDWAVNELVMPNLSKWLKEHSYYWVHACYSQVRGGNSMDGQLIINTGLLPISEGAVSFMFPKNMYPSIADNIKSPKVVIIPHDIQVWNQVYMSPAFHYDTTMCVSEDESLLFSKVVQCAEDGFQLIQVVTMASHAPFTYGATRSSLDLPSDMPVSLSDYMKSVHYTDEQMNILLESINTNPALQDAIMIITGDHTILYDELRKQSAIYCNQQGWNFDIMNNGTPLIIANSNMNDQVHINDVQAYQMDIFPTVMSILGIDDYHWKGFGVDMTDSMARHNRPILEKDAFVLSDKIIRSNYFQK